MYISRIRLKNVRCIDDLEIDLRSRARTNDSLLLLGNNAVGKSTVLRSIAIALCDEVGASGLVADMYGSLVKDGEEAGAIEIDLKAGRREYQTVTHIAQSADDPGLERLRRESSGKVPWSTLFVCGYGPTRVLQGTSTYSQYVAADAVYSLFVYGSPLQNPELVVRRRGATRYGSLLKSLSELLMIPRNAVGLSRRGLTLKNRSGGDNTFGAVADGHRSTLNWILDLIGWTLLTGRMEPRGIVLIDEIENHLHPSWQRHIFRLLSQQFPRVQFIATSHSPLPAGSIYEDRSVGVGRIGKAHVLRTDGAGRVMSEELPPLYGSTYDEILESSAFDTSSKPEVLERAVQGVLAAYAGPRSRGTATFEAAMEHLRAVSPMEAASIAERQVADELDVAFERLLRKKGTSSASSD